MTSPAVRINSRRKTRSTLVALMLVGIGLILLGVMAYILLPKPGASSQAKANVSTAPSAIPMQVDFPAPDLRLADLQGRPAALADYRGQWVLLNNWATWCPPCKAEMPVLQAYYDAYRKQNFTIIAIEEGEPVDQVARFAQEYQLSFPVWPDPEQRVYDLFHNISLPTSWVIDPEGQVRLTWTGAITREALEKYVTPLLKE